MNDLISRAEAIKAVEAIRDLLSVEAHCAITERISALPSAEATCETCADRALCIMSAPDGKWKACKDYRPSAEAVQGWIPCSERLPDVDVEVLATVDWSDVLIAWLKKDGTWETDEYILASDEILAWMPLPKPYKGGEDE